MAESDGYANAEALVTTAWVAEHLGEPGYQLIEVDVPAGAEHDLILDVHAPAAAGDLVLELDLVQEGVAWFADRGSRTLRLQVRISADHGSVSAHAIPVPTMEMHTLPREEVIAAVEDAGGVVLDVIPHDRCGPSIESLDYIVARSWSPAREAGPAGRGPRHRLAEGLDPFLGRPRPHQR